MRIGSLFSGYGGLDMGVQAVLGGTVAWHAEIDKHAAAILAHHWPDVPNLGDVSAVDWSTVEPVDVLTGGFPCQDVSTAGLRKGLAPGTRSGLWSEFARAIDELRPWLVVIENVRGLLSAYAASDMEPCPWCMGDAGDEPHLRALGAVLGDLADVGYDARWCGVRAADAGAPHGRFRVFIVAADAERQRHDGSGDSRRATGEDGGRPDAARPTDTPADASGQRHGRRKDAGVVGRVGSPSAVSGREASAAREVAGDRGAADAADASGSGLQGSPRRDFQASTGRRGQSKPCDSDAPADAGCRRRPEGIVESRDIGATDSEGTTALLDGHRADAAPADASGDGRDEGRPEPARVIRRPDAAERGDADWGPYAAAIHRWERVLGRVAPPPTEPGSNGRPRLSPAFVEWMMGLPPGHVTDVGISRNHQLKALGNGVVPQQAALALTRLLAGAA